MKIRAPNLSGPSTRTKYGIEIKATTYSAPRKTNMENIFFNKIVYFTNKDCTLSITLNVSTAKSNAS